MKARACHSLVPLCIVAALSASPVLACGGGGTSGGSASAKAYSALSAQNGQVADEVSAVTAVVARHLSAVPNVVVDVVAEHVSVKSKSISMSLSVDIRSEGLGCSDSSSSSCHIALQQFVLLPFVPEQVIADQRALTVVLAAAVSRALIDDASRELAGLGAQARSELLAAAEELATSSADRAGG